MAGFGVVVNPEAGRNRRVASRAQRLRAALGSDGVVCEPRSLAELDAVATELCQRAVEYLVICGGDGSYFRTLSACVRAYATEPLPPLLALRAGTMNTIARGIGAPRGRPEAVMARALQRYRRGEPAAVESRQLLRVGDGYVGFMTGAGTIVSFLEHYYHGQLRGHLGAASLMVRLFGSALNGGGFVRSAFRWVDARVCCDGQRVPFDEFSVIYASTITEIGLGFQPTYRARDEAGRFQLIAGPMGATEAARCLPKVWRGLPTGSPNLHDVMACSVAIEFGQPTSYMVDGDVLAPVSRLTIETGPVVGVITEPEA